MKKLLVLFIFFIIPLYSQEEQLNISQIDSIIELSRPKVEASGIIRKRKKVIGGFGTTTYEYKNKLIYSFYNENTKNKEFEFQHLYEFYFHNEKPIFIKINIQRINIIPS